ncbi:unnamed protein product [Orchesella dallaii]|uniref:Uncharacterized protein n=1 Tax=Orchesella dallaii TaxID=48710 RepID=A0ABP1RQR2_9HEXA
MPNLNTTTQNGKPADETNDETSPLFLYLKQEFGKLNAELNTLKDGQTSIQNRFSVVEENINKLTTASEQHTEDILNLQQDIGTIKDSHQHLIEQTQRLVKRSNLVIQNIPETDEAITTIKELLSIILPENNILIREFRIGKKYDGRTRPLRIHLNNQNEVEQAMSNCKYLKGIEKFSKISVTRDFTKVQMIERRQRAINQAIHSIPQSESQMATPQNGTQTAKAVTQGRAKRYATDDIHDNRAKISRHENSAMES